MSEAVDSEISDVKSRSVPAGYKQTEVGAIPEDWEEKSVGSVCKLINGRGFKPHEWSTTGLPIIRIQNLNGSEEFNYFEGTYAKKLEVENGQLLFAWSGSRGTSFGPHIWNGSLGLLNYHTWKVQVDDRVIFREFFLHALKKLTTFIEDRAHGASALVHTQKWEMEGFKFPVPPAEAEQRAIATALSDVDALLGALERLIAKKRDLKQAAMQQLLTGQTRLPGFHGEWEEKSVGSVCKLINGRGFKPHEWRTTGLPIIRIQNLNGSDDFNYFEGPYAKKLEVENGQLLFAWSGSRGTSFGPHVWRGSLGLLNYHTWKVLVDDRAISKEFFLHALKKLTAFIEDRAHGASALVHTQKWEMEGFTLPVPPTTLEQTAIAEVLSDMDAEIAVLEQRRKKVRALKQGMMQELLTGKTRLG